ncbi:MAG: hypothetical protein ABGY09_02950 [Euryarchaeota archaeon]
MRRNGWAWYRPAAGAFAAWYDVHVNGYAISDGMPMRAVWVDARERGKRSGGGRTGAAGLVKPVIVNALRTVPPRVYRTYWASFGEGIAVRLRDLKRIAGRRVKSHELSGYFERRVLLETGRPAVLLFPTGGSRFLRIWSLRDVVELTRSGPWPVEDPLQPLGDG